eukprot:1235255-Rhodomonas_salina.1
MHPVQQSAVLTSSLVLPGGACGTDGPTGSTALRSYAFPTRCPVLTWAMLLPGAHGRDRADAQGLEALSVSVNCPELSSQRALNFSVNSSELFS